MGPFLAPILGGVVGQVWGWRATQWLLVIFSGCNVILILFFLPETLRRSDNLAAIKTLIVKEDLESVDEDIPDEVLSRIASRISTSGGALHDHEHEVILDPGLPSLSRFTTNKSTYSKKLAQEALDDEIRKTIQESSSENNLNHTKTLLYDVLIRPMHSVVLLLYPPVVLAISYSSICFAVIYFFNMAITYEYSRDPYNFKQIIVGLLYIPNSITYVAASIIGGRWTDYLLKKYAMAHNGELVPESRIGWNVVTAVVLFPPACLIFGWTIDYGVFWFVPLIGTAIFGFASMLLIGATVTYLVDTLPGKGATGVALNNLIRQILAAIATFVVEPALKGIGPGILFSILMGITTLASVVLIYLKRHGDYYRENYDLTKYYEKL
jgi:MFS family permease